MDRTIRVTGKGKVAVKPDTIRLDLRMERVFPEYETAVRKSAEETGILRNTLKKAGLAPDGLKTDRFEIDSEYESYRDKKDDWRRRFIGYKYQHSLHIMFPNDNELLGKILYALSGCPVNVEFSISYTVRDTEAVKTALLEKAVSDSRKKAKTLTNAAGVGLGDIISIDYSWGEINIYSRPVKNMVLEEKLSTEMADDFDGYDIDIEADDIDVTDTVTVIWEIG